MGNHGSLSQSISSISNALDYPQDIIQNKFKLEQIQKESSNNNHIKKYSTRHEPDKTNLNINNDPKYMDEGEGITDTGDDQSISKPQHIHHISHYSEQEQEQEQEESDDDANEHSISQSVTLMGLQKHEKLHFNLNNSLNLNEITDTNTDDFKNESEFDENDENEIQLKQAPTTETLMGFETVTEDGQNEEEDEYDDDDDDEHCEESISHSAYLSEIHVIKQENKFEKSNIKTTDYSWWSYTFNAKSKYIIHIQFKIKVTSLNTMKYNQYHPGVFNKKYGARFCSINGIQANILSFNNSNEKVTGHTNVNEYDNNEYIVLKINDNIYRLFFLRRMGWCFDDGNGIYTNIKRVVNGRLDK